MGEAADVSDVLRAVVSAGELLLQGIEDGRRLYTGAKGLCAKLASKLGGGGGQIPLRRLARKHILRSFHIREQDVESLRAKAEDFGIQFAVTSSDVEGVVILVCAKDNESLFRDLITHLPRRDEPVMPPWDAPDYALREQPPGTSYDACQMAPEDAARFCAAAREQGIPYEADTRYVDPGRCLEVLEVPFEAADQQMGEFAPPEDLLQWELIRDAPLCSARMPLEQYEELLRQIPPETAIAAVPGTNDVLCCFTREDRKALEQFVPDLEWFRLVTEETLEERCADALQDIDSVGIATCTEDRERVFSVMSELGIVPQTPPARAAQVQKLQASLSTRLESAMAQMQERSGAKETVLSCTLPAQDAAALRVSAQAAGIPLTETRLPDGRVRFAASPDAARWAGDLLRSAGIRTGFVPAARSAGTDIGR